MTDTATQLERFVSCVYEPTDIVEVRTICGGKVLQSWITAAELPSMQAELSNQNEAGQNIYAGINPRATIGGADADSVALVRNLFADFDGGVTADVAQERCHDAGLPVPTLIVDSGHGVHVYWRIDDPLDDLLGWSALQQRLVIALGSDNKIIDAPRIMRLPDFLNVKKEPFVPCAIVFADPRRQFLSVAFNAVLPPLPPAPAPPAPPEFIARGDVGNVQQRAMAYLDKLDPAIAGQGGHDRTFRAACVLVCDFGLSPDEAYPLLATYNLRCEPPWTERELRHKLEDAARQPGDRGQLLHRPTQRNDSCRPKLLLA